MTEEENILATMYGEVKSMLLMYANIRGLLPKTLEREDCIKCRKKRDVYLTETKLTKEGEFTVSNFEVWRKDSKEKKMRCTNDYGAIRSEGNKNEIWAKENSNVIVKKKEIIMVVTSKR